jgi:pyruvate dehydrogenase E1 component beta subunit
VVVASETHLRAGLDAEIASAQAKEAIEYIDGPVFRIGALSFFLPNNLIPERHTVPDIDDIIEAVRSFWN